MVDKVLKVNEGTTIRLSHISAVILHPRRTIKGTMKLEDVVIPAQLVVHLIGGQDLPWTEDEKMPVSKLTELKDYLDTQMECY